MLRYALLVFLLNSLKSSSIFPVKSFFKDNSRISELITDLSYNLCQGPPGAPQDCYCDQRCLEQSSCCVDVLWNNQSSIQEYRKHFYEVASPRHTLSCDPLVKRPKSTTEWVYMIKDCPQGYDNFQIKQKCANRRIPVISELEVIYRNKYCALCNGIQDFKDLKMVAECENTTFSSQPKSHEYEKCEFRMVDRSNVHKCIEKTVSCSEDSASCKKCRSYSAPVEYNDTCYRNAHCVLENHPDIPEGMDLWACYDPLISVVYGFPLTYSRLVSLSDCPGEKRYDEIRDECVDEEVICAFGYKEVNGVCAKPNAYPSKPILDRDGMFSCLSNYYTRINDSDGVIYNAISSAHRNDFWKSNSTLISSTSKVHVTELYGWDFDHTFKLGICADPVKVQISHFRLTANCFLHFNSTILSPQQYIINTYKTSQNTEKTELVTCNRFHFSSNCKLRRIGEYTLFKNRSIIDLESGVMYHASVYTPLKDGIGVCIEPVSAWIRVIKRVEHYITLIGCSVSIIGYTWTIFTYVVIPELNTVPGKNIVCLCAMLLCSDIFLLLSMISNPSWCTITAYLLHFCSLSAQFWCAVLAFDIWSTFRGKHLMRAKNSAKNFVCYSVFAWTTPFLLITLILMLKFTSNVDFRYGAGGVCWIGSLTGRIVTYMLPVIVLTLFTVFTLSYTLYKIHRQHNKSGRLLQRSGGDTVSLARMALKLIVLLGAIEVFGFVHVESNSDATRAVNVIIQLIYTTSRSFRGLFICVLYVVTERVLNIYTDIKSTGSINLTRRKTLVSNLMNKSTEKPMAV